MAALLSSLSWGGSAAAQERSASAPEAIGVPHHRLFQAGMFMLGVAYVPALAVGIGSQQPEDQHLYAPVVGPWLALLDRESCERDCRAGTVDRVLLATDGVFQGLGLLQVLGSVVFPQTRRLPLGREDSSAPAVRVVPARWGGANGLSVTGEF